MTSKQLMKKYLHVKTLQVMRLIPEKEQHQIKTDLSKCGWDCKIECFGVSTIIDIWKSDREKTEINRDIKLMELC